MVGGQAHGGPGYFYPPTVLVDVPHDAEINREEIFGPVAPITHVRDRGGGGRPRPTTPSTACRRTSTPATCQRTIRLAESLDFGMVGVNTGLVSNPAAPFGGVKASGFGREGGFEGIEEYLDTTYVALALAEPAPTGATP